MIYEVRTNLDPQTLTRVAVETFRLWLEFAMGKAAIGGRTLAHPSGAYAASISWRRTGQASIAIIADERKAKVAKWIEQGTPGADIKAAMLAGVAPGKNGYRSRAVPISADSPAPRLFDGELFSGPNGQHVKPAVGRIWAKAKGGRGNQAFAMMSDRPGTSEWRVPPMPAYAPAQVLSQLLQKEYGRGG